MFDHARYGSTIESILGPHEGGQRLMPLAPRGPLRGEGLDRLTQSSTEQLFEGQPIVSSAFAECVRSALFLYFAALDESHTISQGISSPSGSFLHGIMHRQEPDFSNAKYWFRRVPEHEIYAALRQSALDLLKGEAGAAAGRLRSEIERRSQWDPLWFVDECQTAHRGKDADHEQRLLEMQRLEWQLLFDYCYRHAVGKAGSKTA